ncbi:MAG: alpha-ketoglutarate-dependent dioxygenase AlkB [Pseudomonadota bacterium]|nr:alpha-ketoglutarate-dependent dioxygenase AlkB [Pseudomonadota bacterium]
MQFSLFETPENNSSSHKLPLSEGDVTYFPQALSKNDADTFFELLKAELPWRQDSIRLFGKPVKIPRLQSWHGDDDCTYTYSNLTMSPNPWTNSLLSIKDCCEALCAATQNTKFNSVLANWYRDGQDSMSFHSDDEPELGINPVIASVTLGEARPFVFKHKETKEKYTQVLEHGSVLIMAGTTQSHYVHGIAKTAKPISGRINLTFRHLIHRTR